MSLIVSIVNALHKIAALIGGPTLAITQGQLPASLREVLAIVGPAYAALVHALDSKTAPAKP